MGEFNPTDGKDSLQQIKGIGQAIARALHSLEVHCCADLLSFTPDSLAARLKAKVPSISPKRIERDDWLGQARALARGRGKRGASEPEAPKVDEKDAANTPPDDWREQADFIVSLGYAIGLEGEERLRTKVHHSQADETAQWDGIPIDQLINWMLRQADLRPPTEAEALVEPVSPYDARIRILDMRGSLDGPSSGIPEKRLVVNVCFRISGPDAEAWAATGVPYRVEVHTVNLETGASTLVASEGGQLRPRVFEYMSQQAFSIPGVGRYDLHALVLLLPPVAMMTSGVGPPLIVSL